MMKRSWTKAKTYAKCAIQTLCIVVISQISGWFTLQTYDHMHDCGDVTFITDIKHADHLGGSVTASVAHTTQIETMQEVCVANTP